MENDIKEWMAIKELQDRNRCIKCKARLDEFVMCERCLEFKYCSIHCLEDDRDAHLKYCNVIGLRKGLLTRLTDEEQQRMKQVKQKARLLNEDGTVRSSSAWYRKEDENSSEEEDDDNIHVVAGTSESRKDKNTGSKAEDGKYKSNRSNRFNVREQKDKVREETPLKSLIIDGQFGGAVTADKKVQSGESFGKDWWNPKKNESKKDQTSTDLDSASLGDSTHKLNDTKEEQNATCLPSTTSPTQVPLEQALSGLEIVKYDGTQAGGSSGSAQTSSTMGKCSLCRKEGPVLKCSRCKMATYCDKNCQKRDYKKHSYICKRMAKFDIALSQVPNFLKFVSILFMGSFEVSPLLAAVPDRFPFLLLGQTRCHAMVEIIDVHPHPFRYGAIVKDLMGMTTQVLFYSDNPYYSHKVPGMFGISMPIHLSVCIQPGNFILLLDAHWHYFLDGTRGIRIDNVDDVYFIFMDE